MWIWPQVLVSGISLGSFYALVAMGFALIFGVTHAFNLAHGEMILLSGYLAYVLWKFYHLSFYWTLPLCLLITPVIAMGLQVILRQLKEPFELNSLVVTFGLALLLQNIMLALFAADFRLIQTAGANLLDLPDWNLVVSRNQVLLLLLSLTATAGVHLLLHRTFLGKALRATIQDRQAAELAGINVNHMSWIAFALGGSLIGLAGPLFARNMYLYPAGGMEATLIAITITIFAGVGRTRAILLGGWVLGVVESGAALTLGASWREMISACLLISILLIKPKGILSRE